MLNKNPKIEDCRFEDSTHLLSLSKIYDKKIKDLVGFISQPFDEGTFIFEISKVVFEDGSDEWLDGEHELAFIPMDDANEKTFKKLFKQQNN